MFGKKNKEIEKKMLIRRTINSMNKQIAALEEQKRIFIDKARTAKKNGLEAQYNLALTGYKMTLTQQKRAQEMLLNFEITSQMKDMTMMTSQFLGGMSVLSKEMSKLADKKEFVKVQQQFELAMANVEVQVEQIEDFMESSRSTFSSAAGSSSAGADADLGSFIDEQSASSELSDDDIDKEMAEIRKKIDAGNL